MTVIEICVGIDAGGTYTDVVVYNPAERSILGSAKALTTKSDLSVGIGEALDRMDKTLLRQVSRVSLSTTLATNACVEEKGGNGKLLFIDVDPMVVDWVGGTYGLPPREDILFLSRKDVEAPAAVMEKNRDWLTGAEGIAVVDLNAADRSMDPERMMRAFLEDTYGIPVVCGHELYNELNSLRRGASTLLNVRLIPVIAEFLQAIRQSLEQRGIAAPVTIVRSDGTLMSESFTGVRPVETLLCGPAAGLVGVEHLVSENDCLVIDMGGTTTDISIIRDHKPLRAEEGIQVGRWRTFAQGMFVDTFGLGGDSTIQVDRDGVLSLGTRRSMPLCMAASRWPDMKRRLRAMISEKPRHTKPLHQFFILARDPGGLPGLSEAEARLCRELQNGPVIYQDAAELLGTDVYNINIDRLEREGYVLRSGLTPTDIMHLKGDFAKYDVDASRLGATFLAACSHQTMSSLGDLVYDLVKRKLYGNIVRVLLQQQYPALRGEELNRGIRMMVEQGWELHREGMGKNSLHIQFQTPCTLVGIGAPIHIFLPDVAKALSVAHIIPEHAEAANALGAAVSQVEATYRLDVRLQLQDSGDVYKVNGPYNSFETPSREEAVDNAVEQAKRAARDEAVRRGIQGDVQVRVDVTHRECKVGYDSSTLYLGSVVEAVAFGTGSSKHETARVLGCTR